MRNPSCASPARSPASAPPLSPKSGMTASAWASWWNTVSETHRENTNMFTAFAFRGRQPYTVRRNTAQGATLRPKLANRPDAPASAGKS